MAARRAPHHEAPGEEGHDHDEFETFVVEGAEVDDVEALKAKLRAAIEAHGILRETIEAAPEKMFPRILEQFRAGGDVSAADYIAGWQRLEGHRRTWHDRTVGYDAVMLPTSPILPPDARRLADDGAFYVAKNLLALRNARIASLMGLCAMTLPTGQPSCGISLMAPSRQEERLLRLAVAVESALG